MMLGGPLAFVLATLSLSAPCLGPTCGVDIAPDPVTLPDAPPSVTDGPIDAPPTVEDPLAQIGAPTPGLSDLLSTSIPAPSDRSPTPEIETPSQQTRPSDPAARTLEADGTPQPSPHGPRTAPIPPTQGEPVPADGHAHPTRTRVNGAPIDASAPARTIAAFLIGLATIGLYHRLSKDRILEHSTRQRILSLVEDAPGLTTSELADKLDVSYRTARHHAEMLAGFDLLRSEQTRNGQRWHLPGQADELQEPLSEAEHRVLDLVAQHEGLHLSEIARRCSMAKATAKFQLDRLAEKSWIADERTGPLRCFTVTDAGRSRLASESDPAGPSDG